MSGGVAARRAGSACSGVCVHGMDVKHIDKKYLERPVSVPNGGEHSLLATGSSDVGTKVLPYVNNRHLNRQMGLLGKYEDLGHAETYYNPARESLYSRYTPGDWHFANQSNYNMSTSERNTAEKVRTNATWCVKQTDARTKSRQNHVTSKLGERCDDIAFWGSELDNECKAMGIELKNLKDQRNMVDNVITDSFKPLDIVKECLRQREKRTGIDLVKDDVEKALNKEAAIVKKCQDKLGQLVRKAKAQLKLDTAALNSLEMDAEHKNHAHKVDNKMAQLSNSSAGIGYHPGIEYYDNTITVPVSWLKYTQTNIKRAQKEREASERIRNDMDECARNALNAMWNTFTMVNNALAARIRETTDTRNKLVAHLKRTMGEIATMEKSVEKIREAIREKEAPMKVAQTRLDERSRRIDVELCNDPVMKSLLKEVEEIRESVRILKGRLKPADLSLARLIKTMTCLQHDIAVKENTLEIDGKICLGMRKQFPMASNMHPLTSMPLASY